MLETIPEEDMVTDTHPEAVRVFTCFPDLPTELKIQIWEHAIAPARTVMIDGHFPKTQDHHFRPKDFIWAPLEIPLCLSTCFMTGEVARTHKDRRPFNAGLPEPVYMDVKKDVLVMSGVEVLKQFRKMCHDPVGPLRDLKYLAIDLTRNRPERRCKNPSHPKSFSKEACDLLRQIFRSFPLFSSLNEICIIRHHECPPVCPCAQEAHSRLEKELRYMAAAESVVGTGNSVFRYDTVRMPRIRCITWDELNRRAPGI